MYTILYVETECCSQLVIAQGLYIKNKADIQQLSII